MGGKRRSDTIYKHRKKVLDYARLLARSGAHPDHTSIIPHLETLEGFGIARDRTEERAFRLQLDRICAMVRGAAL